MLERKGEIGEMNTLSIQEDHTCRIYPCSTPYWRQRPALPRSDLDWSRILWSSRVTQTHVVYRLNCTDTRTRTTEMYGAWPGRTTGVALKDQMGRTASHACPLLPTLFPSRTTTMPCRVYTVDPEPHGWSIHGASMERVQMSCGVSIQPVST